MKETNLLDSQVLLRLCRKLVRRPSQIFEGLLGSLCEFLIHDGIGSFAGQLQLETLQLGTRKNVRLIQGVRQKYYDEPEFCDL